MTQSEADRIHPTAIVDPGAVLGEGVSVGAYAIIGPDVVIGDGTWIGPHAVVKGPTVIGRNNKIFQFASIGEDCQDKKYRGEPTRLEIGDNNVFREFTTVQRGTVQDQGVTRVGNGLWLMNYCHIAHDCVVGNDVVIANATQLAGHVHLGDGVIIGGNSGIHQYCRVGPYAMIGGASGIRNDVPAFVTTTGNPGVSRGLNYEGMKRRNFEKPVIHELRRAYKLVYQSDLTQDDALKEIDSWGSQSAPLALFTDSIRTSTRGIIQE